MRPHSAANPDRRMPFTFREMSGTSIMKSPPTDAPELCGRTVEAVAVPQRRFLGSTTALRFRTTKPSPPKTSVSCPPRKAH